MAGARAMAERERLTIVPGPGPGGSIPPELEHERMVEAILFAAAAPLDAAALAALLPPGADVDAALSRLELHYRSRGVRLMRLAGGWAFRTAPDLGALLRPADAEPKKLSRAGLETLAIVAYHQPVTRAEIEAIRGVSISKGTLDVLIETGWVRLRGRRRTPGRPVTYGTTPGFLAHFGLDAITDLPGLDDLKGAGLFDGRLPGDMYVPMPSDDPELTEDEDPIGDTLDFFTPAVDEDDDRDEETP